MKIKNHLMFFLILSGFYSKVWAFGVDVVTDPTEHALTNTVIAKDLAIIGKLHDQITHLNSIKNNLSGVGTFGSLFNDQSQLNNRLTNASWDDALKNIAGGNVARYQELKSKYEAKHKLQSVSEYSKGVADEQKNSYKNSKETTEAASLNSEIEFNNINQELKNIHEISKKIDGAQTQKQISDLNARLMVELAYLQAESLRMQAIQNKQLSAQAAKNLAAKSFESQFTTYKEED